MQAQPDYTFDSQYRSFEQGKNRVLFEDTSYLYTGPSFKANKQEVLFPGAVVSVQERMDELSTRNGFRTNWYRVDYRLDSRTITGFIWGGALAFQVANSIEKPSLRFVMGLASNKTINRGNYQEQVIYLKIVVLDNLQVLDSITLEAIGSLYTNVRLKAYGNRGLFSIQDVLEINFSDGYCGGVSASITLFWDGFKLHYIDLLSNGYSSTTFYHQFFIYPQEKGGKRRSVVRREERGIYDENHLPRYQYHENKLFVWDGKRLYVQD